MRFYQLFMFLHVACVIVWLGCAVSLTIRTFAAERTHDHAAVTGIVDDAFGVFDRVFALAATGALLFGLVLTWLAWDFRELWIDIGLAGFAASAGIGAVVLSGRKSRLLDASARHGAHSRPAIREARQFLAIAQLDTLILAVMVADMVFKPEADNVPALAAMAAAVILGAVAVWRRLRQIAADEG